MKKYKGSCILSLAILMIIMFLAPSAYAVVVNSPKTVIAQVTTSTGTIPSTAGIAIQVTDANAVTATLLTAAADGIIAYDPANGSISITMASFPTQWVIGDSLTIKVSVGTSGQAGYEVATTTTLLDAQSLQAFVAVNGGVADPNLTIKTVVQTVADTVSPTVTAPVGITVAATSTTGTATTQATIATFLAAATAIDNVKVIGGVTHNAPATFPVGVTTVIFSAKDAAGNKGTATANVTVSAYVDVVKPTVTAPAAITVAATSATGTATTQATIATFLTAATAVDNVKVIGGVTHNAPTTFPVGATKVTFSAVDAAGNTGTATALVTVSAFVDKILPIVTAPANITVAPTSTAGTSVTNATIAAFLKAATATDNIKVIGGVTHNAPTTFPIGATKVTFSAVDAAGNKGIATAVVTVSTFVDKVLPVVTAPAAITVAGTSPTGVPATNATIAAFLKAATATDNIKVIAGVTHNAPTTFPVGATTVTFTAVDAAGNTGTATAVVTVSAFVDKILPIVTAPANITVAGTSPTGVPATNATIAAFLKAATATDNVKLIGGVTHNAPTIFPVGPTTVTFTALDAAGNKGTATALVTVSAFVDKVLPVVTAPANLDLYTLSATVISATDQRIIAFLGGVRATDNIAVVGGVSNNAGTVFPLGISTVTFTAVDAAGNTGTATATVRVTLNHNPVAKPNSAVTTADLYAQIKGVLVNDSDPDGNTLMVTGVDAYSAANGTVIDNYAGNFTYIPPAGFTGMDRFHYVISDGIGGSATGVVTISVRPNLSPAPIAGKMPPVLLRNGNNGLIMQVGATKTLPSFAVNDAYTNADAYTYTASIVPPATAFSVIQSATFGVPSASRLTIVAGATAGTDQVNVTVRDPVTMLTSSVLLTVTVQNPNAGGNTPAPAGDGLTVAQKTALNLNLNATDTDGDGTPDSMEIGDPLNPYDLDGDGVIDALEPANNSGDSSKAFGMRDQSGATVGIDSYGNTLTGVRLAPAPATASKPTGITLEMIAYEAHLPANTYTAVSRLVFSAALPSPLNLYKVDAAGVYTPLPTFNTTTGEGWSLINANTVELSLKDGGQFDQDGKVNGIVVDPIAVAAGAVTATIPASAIPTLLFPTDGATGIALSAGSTTLKWQIASPNTAYTYNLELATDAAMTQNLQRINVTTITLALAFPVLGFAVFGMLGWYQRRIVLGVLLAGSMMLSACPNPSPTPPPASTAVTTLAPATTLITKQVVASGLLTQTTYFWRIIVTDPATGATASSQVWSFTIQ